MVQIESRPAAPEREVTPSQAPTPRVTGDIRQLIPPLGLREYWYPALEAKKVKSKPVGLKMCGEDLVLFRGKDGEVACLWNVCPHRGGSLMHGDCHFPGTLSCPYHGWTFDGEGNLLAVLPEGPDSKMPGRVRARKYPTQTHKGIVFVWMGEGEPAPIEEDVPPEFFDATSRVYIHTEHWPVQWQVALENGGDAHVPYVHRDAMTNLMSPMGFFGSATGAPQKIINGRAVASDGYGDSGPRGGAGGGQKPPPYQRYFPALNSYWPKHRWRLTWTWLLGPFRKRRPHPAWPWPEEWVGGAGGGEHHLPGMYRRDYGDHFYTRQCIAVTENLSRQIYFWTLRPANPLQRLWEYVSFKFYKRWSMFTNFSEQDMRAVVPQRYDTPEHLSPTDIHQVYWRRLVLQARGMMPPGKAEAVPTTEAEKLSLELSPKRRPGD